MQLFRKDTKWSPNTFQFPQKMHLLCPKLSLNCGSYHSPNKHVYLGQWEETLYVIVTVLNVLQ